MNQADDREKIENLKIDADAETSKIRPILANKRKKNMRDYIDANGKFLKFKLSTKAVGGRADLADQSSSYFGLGDLMISDESQAYSIFPSLKIKDNIHVLRNYFSTNYEKAKSFTTLELKVDMLEVYLEAQTRVNDAHEGEPFTFCNNPDPASIPPPITFHE